MSDRTGERLAVELRRRGLAAPAIVLIEAHRPLRPLLSDAAAFLGPMLSVLGAPGGAVRDLLTRPDATGRLVERLADDDER